MLKKSRTKKLLLFIFISLLFKPLWLFNNTNLGQPADDMYHWIHAATIAFDKDIDYTEDYQIDNGTFNNITNVPSAPPGAGYMSSPFVFIFSQFDNLNSGYGNVSRTNPTGTFGYLGFFFAGLFYTICGFYFLKKLINNKKFNGLIIFCAFLSSLVHFVTTRFLMPHAVEFFLCAVILYIFEKNKSKISKVEFLFLILSYLMLAITRPSTFIYTLVLIMIYRNKFDISKANLIIYIPISSMFSYLYIWISRTLYSQNYMFLNTYGSDMDSYRATLNIDQILNGLIKLPNLFVSPSMGILWSTPIVFFGILYMFFAKNKINIDYFLLFIFFAGSFSPLLIWQGREVAYGQRLLIGIIPMCVLLVSRNLQKFQSSKLLLTLSSLFTYIGYLFFYSSNNLTLRYGTTLWGTIVGFAGTNYYIEVIKGLYNFEIILSAFLRNIYVVNISKFTNINEIIFSNVNINSFDANRIGNFFNYLNIYSEVNTAYLLLVNVLVFGFSYLFIKLFFNDFSANTSK